MKKVIIITLSTILIYLTAQIAYSGYYILSSRNLLKVDYNDDLTLGDKSDPKFKVFVAGDSVATGVGASSFEKSTPGRLAYFLAKNYSVEFVNQAESGTKMADLLKLQEPTERQDLIVLIVSTNDVFRFTDLNNFGTSTKNVLDKYSRLANKLIFLGPGKVSTAPALPPPLRYIYKIQESKYTTIIEKTARKYSNVVYIKPGDPPKDTFASDNFHPNDAGHKVWFEGIKDAI